MIGFAVAMVTYWCILSTAAKNNNSDVTEGRWQTLSRNTSVYLLRANNLIFGLLSVDLAKKMIFWKTLTFPK